MHGSIVLSFAPQFSAAAFEEVRSADPSARVVEWMAPGVARVALRSPFPTLASILRGRPPVFVRHMCPLQKSVPFSDAQEDVGLVVDAALRLAADSGPHPAPALTVQTRVVGSGLPHTADQIAATVQAALGRPSDADSGSDGVLSVVVAPDRAWLGVSRREDNLNPWPGGERHYARTPDTISRAEFKLQEALDLFGLDLPTSGLALDLGAAPGGWTKLLRRAGLDVAAVDPGDLHASLSSDPHIHHIRQLAQPFLVGDQVVGVPTRQPYKVIVNDMRLDAVQSTKLMCAAAPRLAVDGLAVMTLKLPERRGAQLVNSARRTLQTSFDVVAMRQLYSNRSEVTVVLRSRDSRPEPDVLPPNDFRQ